MSILKLTPWNWLARENYEHVPEHGQQRQNYVSPFTLHREIDKLFEDAFRHVGRFHGGDVEGMMTPRMDIAASPSEYKISAELPGIEEKDIHLEVKNDALVLKAEKQCQLKEEKDGCSRVERQYGVFQRILQMPEDAVADEIKATSKNGVLYITIPRKEPQEPLAKRIEIK